jgi:hypothetical protein
VIATEYYQVELVLTCPGSCFGSFPKPGNKRRLNITRMSCLITGAPASTYDYGYAELQSASNARVLRQFLPADHSSPAGYHSLNRAVDIRVGSQQHIMVVLNLNSAAGSFACTASGTRDTLQ